jgi:hypothetical protein
MADVVDGGQVFQRESDTGPSHAACEQCKNSSESQSGNPVAAK